MSPLGLLSLPNELIANVFRHLHTCDRFRLLQVSREFYQLGLPLLYGFIWFDLREERTRFVIRLLFEKPQYARYVLHLAVDWESQQAGEFSILTDDSNNRGVLVDVLQKLPNVQILTLTFSEMDIHAVQVLDDLASLKSFQNKLTKFSTNILCDQHMLSFLQTQSNLRTLDLTMSPLIRLTSPATPLPLVISSALHTFRWTVIGYPYHDPSLLCTLTSGRQTIRITVDPASGIAPQWGWLRGHTSGISTLELSLKPFRHDSFQELFNVFSDMENLVLGLFASEIQVCLVGNIMES